MLRGEREEAWRELGNSAQLWPSGATTPGAPRVEREETEPDRSAEEVHRVTEANSVRANQCRWLRDVTKVAGNKTVTTSLCSSVQNFSQLRTVMMFLTSPTGTSKVINLEDIDL